jgi:hypothetical protein
MSGITTKKGARSMKTLRTLAIVLAAGAAWADLPKNVKEVTWIPGETSASVAGLYAAGGTLTISNGIVCSAAAVGTNAPARLDLTGLGGTVTMGDLVIGGTNTVRTFTTTTVTATSGTFYVALTLPAYTNILGGTEGTQSAVVPLQLSLTNAAGSRFVYPGLKMLSVFRPLGE